MFSDLPADKSGVYFVGIGGISMSALACLLQDSGIKVRGSDGQEGRYTKLLRARGIPVSIGEAEEIAEDVVVYTGAVDETHRQLAAAKSVGKRLMPRSELLGRIAEGYPQVLSVAGCHGKTTASCMLSHIFLTAKRKFTCHIGGEDSKLGNYASTGKDCFITEACEFKRSFLSLKSTVGIILNCDRDHTDCYRDEEELAAAYAQFAANAKYVVVNADDLTARRIPHTVSFGFNAGDVRAESIRSREERYSFIVTEKGVPVVRVRLNVAGRVHILNALAAYCAARIMGLSPEEIRAGLEDFQGVRRRFECVGTLYGCPVICDYAHHPREIAAAIRTADRLAAGSVHVVFQPHTYTRTRDLMEDFVDVFRRTGTPIFYRTYSAREPFDFDGSAVSLAARIADSIYVQSPVQLKCRLKELVKEDDLILVLGAGDIYDIACSILDLAENAGSGGGNG